MLRVTEEIAENRKQARYLITDPQSGLVDGYYRTVAIANEVANDLSNRFGRKFEVSKIEGVPPYIPDARMFDRSDEYMDPPYGRQ